MIIDTAVKQLRANASEDMRLKLLQEAAIMGQFNHRNVVKLYGVVTDGPAVRSCRKHLRLLLSVIWNVVI